MLSGVHKEGLHRSRTKSLNYTQLSMIDQGFNENLIAFLERIRKALVKQITLSPDSVKGPLILKDTFITQKALVIRRKLQPWDQIVRTLEDFLKGRHKKEAEALIATMQAHKPQNSQGAPVNCHRCGKNSYLYSRV